MKLLVVLAVCSGCATIRVNQTARFNPGIVNQVYDLAEKSFVKRLPCSLPRNIELTIRDISLVDLNKGRNLFGPDGVYIRQGLYEPETKTISLAAEKPDRRYLLFHELLHFFITESPDCLVFKNVKIQHAAITIMDEDYFAAAKTTREQENNYHWILEVVEKL